MAATRIAFVTCVQLGMACLEAIDELNDHVDALITLPDEMARKKSGRVYLDEYANRCGITLKKFRNINDTDAREWLRAQAFDWILIIGWSQIAGDDVLRCATRGAVGMHPTLLPEGRGRAAVPWAILKCLSVTGVTMFRLDTGVDTGPILGQLRVPIAKDEDATRLYAKIQDAHRELIRQMWPQLRRGTIVHTPQDDSKATIWPGRTPADGELVSTMSVDDAERLVRAVTRPYPGAFMQMPEGRRVRVWRAIRSTGEQPPPASPNLRFVDGSLIAVDYDWE